MYNMSQEFYDSDSSDFRILAPLKSFCLKKSYIDQHVLLNSLVAFTPWAGEYTPMAGEDPTNTRKEIYNSKPLKLLPFFGDRQIVSFR